MSTALQSVVLERERLLYPGKNLGSHTNISDFMTDKMADAGRARSERVIRLESKIKEVECLDFYVITNI
jgi:sorting nexin-4